MSDDNLALDPEQQKRLAALAWEIERWDGWRLANAVAVREGIELVSVVLRALEDHMEQLEPSVRPHERTLLKEAWALVDMVEKYYGYQLAKWHDSATNRLRAEGNEKVQIDLAQAEEVGHAIFERLLRKYMTFITRDWNAAHRTATRQRVMDAVRAALAAGDEKKAQRIISENLQGYYSGTVMAPHAPGPEARTTDATIAQRILGAMGLADDFQIVRKVKS